MACEESVLSWIFHVMKRTEVNKAIKLIKSGNEDGLAAWLPDVERVPPELLYWAGWEKQNLQIVRMLLNAGADPDAACNADTPQQDSFSRMSFRELASILADDGEDGLNDALADFESGNTPTADEPAYAAWSSTQVAGRTAYRKGGRLVVTGSLDSELQSPGVTELDNLAASLVDAVSKHADGFVRAWNITSTGRISRNDREAVLSVNLIPDEDEGYEGDDSPLTAVFVVVDNRFILCASNREQDTELVSLAGIEWPQRGAFEDVPVYHGE